MFGLKSKFWHRSSEFIIYIYIEPNETAEKIRTTSDTKSKKKDSVPIHSNNVQFGVQLQLGAKTNSASKVKVIEMSAINRSNELR